MTQLAVVLRRGENGWELRMAVGEAGCDHARELSRQAFPTSFESASLVGGLLAGMTGDDRLAEQARELFSIDAERERR